MEKIYLEKIRESEEGITFNLLLLDSIRTTLKKYKIKYNELPFQYLAIEIKNSFRDVQESNFQVKDKSPFRFDSFCNRKFFLHIDVLNSYLFSNAAPKFSAPDLEAASKFYNLNNSIFSSSKKENIQIEIPLKIKESIKNYVMKKMRKLEHELSDENFELKIMEYLEIEIKLRLKSKISEHGSELIEINNTLRDSYVYNKLKVIDNENLSMNKACLAVMTLNRFVVGVINLTTEEKMTKIRRKYGQTLILLKVLSNYAEAINCYDDGTSKEDDYKINSYLNDPAKRVSQIEERLKRVLTNFRNEELPEFVKSEFLSYKRNNQLILDLELYAFKNYKALYPALIFNPQKKLSNVKYLSVDFSKPYTTFSSYPPRRPDQSNKRKISEYIRKDTFPGFGK